MVVKEYKVYFIKNKINNKIYIGQTSQKLIYRINRHGDRKSYKNIQFMYID